MGDRYQIYRVVKVTWTKRVSLVVFLGCNKEYHVDSVDMVYYDTDGKVKNAKHIADIEHGFCDGRCSRENHGFFECPLQTLK